MIDRVAFDVDPIVEALGRDAVVVVEGVLDVDRVASIRDELDRVLADTLRGLRRRPPPPPLPARPL